MFCALISLFALSAAASNLEAPADDAPVVIRVTPVAPESRAPVSPPARVGCAPRMQAPSGLTVLPVAVGERQADGRRLCSWLVTAQGADSLQLGVLGRGNAARDGLRVLRADGTEVTSVDAILTPEQAVLTVPSTVVVELYAQTLDAFDGVYARVLSQ